MDRPRSFISANMSPPMATPLSDVSAQTRAQAFVNSPMGISLVAFIISYVGLGASPGAWPLAKLYPITDTSGKVEAKRRAVVAAILAASAYYAKHYIG